MNYKRKYSDEVCDEIIRLRILSLEHGTGWNGVYEKFPHMPRSSIKDIFYRWERSQRAGGLDDSGVPQPEIVGSELDENDIDEEEVWRIAMQLSRRRKEVQAKKREHQILFPQGPVALVFLADLHLGSRGVDYERIDNDINIILSTPGMFVCHVGDVIDNFIVGKLRDVRLGASFSVSEEWAIAKRVLRLLAPRLLLSVAGNHDLWTYAITNVDYLAEVHAQINPNVLYTKYDHNVTLGVNKETWRLRVRHLWKGYSQYNPTHGIEWAAKFDKGEHFDIGIGAHTHISGLYRQFNNGGRTGHAVVCGSYKFDDEYAEKKGLPKPNEAAAVCLVICDGGEIFGTNSLAAASRYMRIMYAGG